MSMPSFPPCGADMTKDEALTMIIASIAMEELALSHIVNAEGEKLQYVLGTLPDGPKICASNQEILAVNKSVRDLLNTVMQNQMLLKGKLEKALEAGGHKPAPEQPCGGECCQKSAIRLVSRCNGFTWDRGFLLTWKCQGLRGCDIRWNEETPAMVSLDPGKAYALDYTINIRGPYRENSAGAVLIKLTPCDAFLSVLPLYFSVDCPDCEPLTLRCSTVLFPQTDPAPCADLSLLLSCGSSLFVERASLDIFEI